MRVDTFVELFEAARVEWLKRSPHNTNPQILVDRCPGEVTLIDVGDGAVEARMGVDGVMMIRTWEWKDL